MNRLPLVIIILIGIAAPSAATLLYFFWRPSDISLHGELTNLPLPPPVFLQVDGESFPPSAWREKWWLVQIAAAECDSECRRRLCVMRQLRLMIPGKYLRVGRIWLIEKDGKNPPSEIFSPSDCGIAQTESQRKIAREVEILDGVILLRLGESARRWLPIPSAGKVAGDYLYIADSSGRIVFRYEKSADIYKIRRDFKRLLKYN